MSAWKSSRASPLDPETQRPSTVSTMTVPIGRRALRARRGVSRPATSSATLRFWCYKCLKELGDDKEALTALASGVKLPYR